MVVRFLLSMVVAWPLAHFVEAPIRKQKVLKGRKFAIAWASVAALIVVICTIAAD